MTADRTTQTSPTAAARAAQRADRALEGTITLDGLYDPQTGARAWQVREGQTWYRVLAVNPNSVSVADSHGARRIPIAKLRAVRFA